MEDPRQPHTSPLDPVLVGFLRYLSDLPEGFAPGRQSSVVAVALDVQDALVEAVFISARTRGLIQPEFNARGRRRRWVLSPRGREFLARASHL